MKETLLVVASERVRQKRDSRVCFKKELSYSITDSVEDVRRCKLLLCAIQELEECSFCNCLHLFCLCGRKNVKKRRRWGRKGKEIEDGTKRCAEMEDGMSRRWRVNGKGKPRRRRSKLSGGRRTEAPPVTRAHKSSLACPWTRKKRPAL